MMKTFTTYSEQQMTKIRILQKLDDNVISGYGIKSFDIEKIKVSSLLLKIEVHIDIITYDIKNNRTIEKLILVARTTSIYICKNKNISSASNNKI